jgi:hypothetical protein
MSLILGFLLMVRVVYRYDPPVMAAAPGAPVGIRGWLTLPAIGVVVHPVIFLYMISQLLRFTDARIWKVLPTMVAAPYRSWAQPVLLISLACAAGIFCFTCTVAVLFFRRRTSAPRLFIIMLCVIVSYLWVLTELLRDSGIKTSLAHASVMRDLIRGIASTALWSSYMLRSRRVKATFINRLPGGHAAATSAQQRMAEQTAN